MGIEDILMHDESLFQNINAFDPDYLPPNYNFRDTQMEAMAMAIRPAMRGGQPSSAVVLGSPATGKTTAIKKVYELVEKNTEKVVAFILTVSCIPQGLESYPKFTKRFSDFYLRKREFHLQGYMKKSCWSFKKIHNH